MEKNRIRPIAGTKVMRMSYSRQKEVLEMPNLIEVQKDSYQWFLDEGLKEVFDDISPIADYSGALSLEFVDFELCKDDVKYSIEECKERDATFAAPLKVKVRLYNKEKEEISEHEIFMGDLPLMTETGTFVINGAERVIVSQLVRSPGIYYGIGHDKIGKKLFTCTVIPNRGAWLEYETDSNDVFYVRVDRTRKVPITVLIRALGIGTNDEIRELFGDEPKIEASFTKDTAENYQEGLLELYKKIRPGEPLSVESAESLINAMFFDPRRYDLAKVGRYKFNKKLALKNRIRHQILAADVVDPSTGEVIASAGDKVTAELADTMQNSAVPFVYIQTEEKNVKVLSNLMVDLTHYVDCNPRDFGIHELVYYPVLAQILAFVICWIYMLRRYEILRLAREDFRDADTAMVKNMLGSGLSMGFMSSLVNIGSLTLQTAINKLGQDIIVAHTAARKISEIFMTMFSVFGQTMATYCGQNLGAGRIDRVKKGIRIGIFYTCIWCTLSAVASYTIGSWLVYLVTGSTNEVVILNATSYLKFDTLFYYVTAVICVLRNAMQGLGDHITPLISSSLEMAGKIVIAATLVPMLGYTGVIVAEPLVWFIMVIPLVVQIFRMPVLREENRGNQGK